MDRIVKENIRENTQTEYLDSSMFGHVQWEDSACILQRMANTELTGRKKGGRPQRKEDLL